MSQRRILTAIAAVVLLSVGFAGCVAQPDETSELDESFLSDVVEQQLDRHGVPRLLVGDLGVLGPGDGGIAALAFALELLPALGGTGAESFVVRRAHEDRIGRRHVKLQQTLYGLPVIGAQLVVHAHIASRQVYAVNGRFVPSSQVRASTPTLDGSTAIASAAGSQSTIRLAATPDLLYVVDDQETTHLTWHALVELETASEPVRDHFYVDATTGALVTRRSTVLHAQPDREVYAYTSFNDLPGRLLLREGDPSIPDVAAMEAYDNLGVVHAYYWDRFARDSFDGLGSKLVATVHHPFLGAWLSEYRQMLLGDGTPFWFGRMTHLDVVTHELTHGVAIETGMDEYSGETGALHEGLADVFAVSASVAQSGITPTTWRMLGDRFTATVPGDALRYLDHPTAYTIGAPSDFPARPDHYSDYNPWTPSHEGGAIVSHVFYLLSQGGMQSSRRNTLLVDAIGIERAEQIFYRALDQYAISAETFSLFRNSTVLATRDLYPGETAVERSVTTAWDAVGVSSSAPPPPAAIELTEGDATLVPRMSIGGWTYYVMDVPAGLSRVEFQTFSGTGDVDLFVRPLALPTLSSWVCRSQMASNRHTCTVESPVAGQWYVGLYSFTGSAGVWLSAQTYAGSEPKKSALVQGEQITSLAGDMNTWRVFSVQVPANTAQWSVRRRGVLLNADLYVRFGSPPDPTHYNCRASVSDLSQDEDRCTIATPLVGTWYIGLYGRLSYAGIAIESFTETSIGTPPVTNLQSGVLLGGVSGASGQWRYFRLPRAPSRQDGLTIELSGGSGDADLYVRRGTGLVNPDYRALPTKHDFHCRVARVGNQDTCRWAFPEPGEWYIALRGHAPYASSTLRASYSAPNVLPLANDVPVSAGSGYPHWKHFSISVPAFRTRLDVTATLGLGTAELFVRHGAVADSNAYQCRAAPSNNLSCVISNPRAGTWYIAARMPDVFSGLSVRAHHIGITDIGSSDE